MSEIETIKTKIENEVKTVETEVKAVATEAKQEAVKVEKAARIELEVADKLAVREIENQFLRAKQDEQHIQQSIVALINRYQATVKAYTAKYVKDAEYQWNELQAAFVRVEKKL